MCGPLRISQSRFYGKRFEIKDDRIVSCPDKSLRVHLYRILCSRLKGSESASLVCIHMNVKMLWWDIAHINYASAPINQLNMIFVHCKDVVRLPELEIVAVEWATKFGQGNAIGRDRRLADELIGERVNGNVSKDSAINTGKAIRQRSPITFA